MLHNKTIGIIGAGAMGSALCRGLVNGGAALPESIYVSDPHAAHVELLRTTLGIQKVQGNREAARGADILILAVKPSNVGRVLEEIGDALERDSAANLPLLISIAAGVPL